MINSIANPLVRAATPARFNVFKFIGLARQRRALANLEDHILKDVGITRTQALKEADRPLWDAPSNWKR